VAEFIVARASGKGVICQLWCHEAATSWTYTSNISMRTRFNSGLGQKVFLIGVLEERVWAGL
jgi:hypothetical protein